MNKLKLFYVNEQYIRYLKQYDKKSLKIKILEDHIVEQ